MGQIIVPQALVLFSRVTDSSPNQLNSLTVSLTFVDNMLQVLAAATSSPRGVVESQRPSEPFHPCLSEKANSEHLF